MITTITLIIFTTSSVFGKYIFKRWFNPILLYAGSWAMMIILYDLKLISYSDVSNSTWLITSLAYLMFLLGIILLYTSKSIINKREVNLVIDKSRSIEILSDDGRYIKYLVIIFGTAGLLAAIQHWYVLMNEYGSVGNLMLAANDIYRMRVEGEHLNKIPYVTSFSYVSVFLVAVYSAYKNKFSSLVILPIVAVVLADAASFARAGIFFAFMLFIITFISFRYYLSLHSREKVKKGNKKFILTALLVILLTFSSVFAIRFFRNPVGDVEKVGARNMHNFRGDLVVTQSLYLYFSSPIVVLEEYFHHDVEHLRFGENMFFPIYNFVKKFDVVEGLNSYPHGYFIPMWSNSATFLRELHADFDYGGIIIFPLLLGFFVAYFWFKFFNTGNFSSLILLSFTEVIIAFSIFYIATRHVRWYIGVVFLLLITNEKFPFYKIKKSEDPPKPIN